MRKKKEMTQRTALEIIETQPDRGGLSDSAILLHKKQCEDFEKMDKRMTKIEEKVDSLDEKVDALHKNLQELKDIIKQRQCFSVALKEVLSNKVFLYILITLMCAIFGVQAGEIGTFLFK